MAGASPGAFARPIRRMIFCRLTPPGGSRYTQSISEGARKRFRKGVLAMRFLIRGENVEVTEALRAYAEKRLGGMLEKYFAEDASLTVHVTMKVYRDGHRVEVTIPTPGLILRAEDKTGDMYAAVDNVAEKIARQIRKYKTRLHRKPRESDGLKGLFRETAEPSDVAPAEEAPRIVRVKRFALKPMAAEEAALQMELLGHTFYVFQNAETDRIGIVYKRRDGSYGLIEPEWA
ncbi:Ribosome hibernation promoting factor [Hydrogenibacillus schlegelii]